MSLRIGAAPAPNRAEQAAIDARNRMGLGDDGPVLDILAAIEEDGVPVTVAPFHRDVAGMYVTRRGRGFVFVNSIDPPERQRFTLAHEFGHHCLKHPARLERSADIGPGRGSNDPEETQANYFAGAFLMPPDAVQRWALRHPDAEADLDLIVRAAYHFGVFAPTARIRLERAGVLSEAASRRLGLRLSTGEHHGRWRELGLHQFADPLSALHARDAYPRLPSAMTRRTAQALKADLIDQEEAEELLRGQPAAPDVAEDDPVAS